MNRHQVLSLLPFLAFGACAQPQSGTQTNALVTEEAPVAPTVEEAAVQTVHLSVTGMTWGVTWVGKVNRALAALPWVEEHSVDFQNKMATIVVDTKSYDEAATVQAVQALGFGVSVM